MLNTAFEYVLPVIRGIQAGREYYVSMCPLRLLPKLFPLEQGETPPEKRARRSLNRTRVPQITQYILDNPQSYTLSAITASIDADITFEPLGTEAEGRKIGRLRVPMDARFTINDGQHRRVAFESALKENPELGYETIPLILFLDVGLKRSQQIFSDLNRYPVRSDPALNLLYDHRDRAAALGRGVYQQVEVFRTLTETERSHLSTRSGKLFILPHICQATVTLLADREGEPLEAQIQQAVDYWNAVSRQIPDWQLVLDRKVSAFEMRRDYLHTQAIFLIGLGAVGATLLRTYPDTWRDHLDPLRQVDWSRSNLDWEGRVIFKGQLSPGSTSVIRMTAYLKQRLNLPLTEEEKRLEHE
ncbi:DNA sulfur modification protein DndB [Laspinema olomoucense]|uniref:DNA sulfur modification protein DndB n=1 Tax=Laspinema olomoucense D3b TaxID=2953688 RepID=A0ABT2NDC2_9CYAN|nr:DNA sulfur modification protein DndB [Laspinema sp. D3b]MCT7980682.1 DNA sulfur modification protein DndB [Laspinema sp. D3b]